MIDYARKFEEVVSGTLGGGLSRRSDMLGLGDADTWENETGGFVSNELHVPVGVIVGLGASYKRVQKLCSEGDEIYRAVDVLYERLKVISGYEAYCRLMSDTKEVYDRLKVFDFVYEKTK